MWQATLRMIGDRPVLGYGPETYEVNFPRYQPAELSAYGASVVTIDHAHNLWLDIAAEKGLVGFSRLRCFSGGHFRHRVWGAKAMPRCGLARATCGSAGFHDGLPCGKSVHLSSVVSSVFFWILGGMSFGLISNLQNATQTKAAVFAHAVVQRQVTARQRRIWLVLAGLLVTLAVVVGVGVSNVRALRERRFKGLQDGWAIDNNCKVLFTPEVAKQIRAAGAGLVRINFRLGTFLDWSQSLTCHGKSALDLYDQVVGNARQQDLMVMGLLGPETWPASQSEWQANSAETGAGNGDNPYLRALPPVLPFR